MKTTIKAYYEGGRGYLNSHRETRQIVFDGSYFVEDKRSAIISAVCQGVPQAADIDPRSVADVYDGVLREYEVHPGVEKDGKAVPCQSVRDDFSGRTLHENSLVIRKSAGGLTIEESRGFSEYRATVRIQAMDIQENDVAYGVVASYYRAQVNGNTEDAFLHELFSTSEEAEAFLELAKESPRFTNASQIEVAVFSRSHIEQTRWYRRSVEALSEEIGEAYLEEK